MRVPISRHAKLWVSCSNTKSLNIKAIHRVNTKIKRKIFMMECTGQASKTDPFKNQGQNVVLLSREVNLGQSYYRPHNVNTSI